ncbi:MAG: DUF58 domain-containing protein [Treponemataceae bacterium]|nr:DUF58 domain-containing protein [Treponemataceae bacterium]
MSSVIESRESLAVRASRLRLRAKTIAGGMKTGFFRSLYRGSGVDFSGVREYMRGDDVRFIDWNVTARMGKTYVKLFEEEKELVVFFVIDRSLSMQQGVGSRSRLEAATETAALLTLASSLNSNPVGAVMFGGYVEFSCAPEAGRDCEMLILSHLDTPPDKKVKGSVLANALHGSHKLLKSRSLIFVISDFRTVGYEKELARLALKHDVIAVRCTDSCDTELPDAGSIPFFDAETGIKRVLPTSQTAFRKAWRDDNRLRVSRWQGMCARRGVIPLVLPTDADPVVVLSQFFKQGH